MLLRSMRPKRLRAVERGRKSHGLMVAVEERDDHVVKVLNYGLTGGCKVG